MTCWSRADDKRLFRLGCYLWSTRTHKLFGGIANPIEDLRTVLYTDAYHASGIDFIQATSGADLCVEEPPSFWPLSWMSKKQTSTSRSTTEAEIVSSATGYSMQFQPLISQRSFLGKICSSHVAKTTVQLVISIVHLGYL